MVQLEPDIHNFSTPPPTSHRLPTISGTQALQNVLKKNRGISTSLPNLDHTLSLTPAAVQGHGVQKGCVTEVYGPPGVGKTTFAMQVAVNAILSTETESRVVWINTGSPLVSSRFDDLLETCFNQASSASSPSTSSSQATSKEDLLKKFTYLEIQSLPRFLTLLIHPPSTFPPAETSLIIIDDLSTAVLSTVPRQVQSNRSGLSSSSNNPSSRPAETPSQKAANRRLQIIETLGTALTKLASAGNIAILVLSNATISLKSGPKAMLKPALDSQTWNSAVHTRIMLYRDFSPPEQKDKLTIEERRGYRLAEVVRLHHRDVVRDAVPFVIITGGLRAIDIDDPTVSQLGIDDPDGTPSARRPDVGRGGGGGGETSDTPVDMDHHTDERHEPQTVKLGKRKAYEIADSDDDDNDDASEKSDGTALPPSRIRGPASALSEGHNDNTNTTGTTTATGLEEDEMLLDTYEAVS